MSTEMNVLKRIIKLGSTDIENFTHTRVHEWVLTTLFTNKLVLLDEGNVYPTPLAYEVVRTHAEQTN